jgi:hypothetical protein
MPTEGGIIIGGDGYAYVPYSYSEWAYPIQFNHFLLLRIDSSGAYETIRVFDWTSVINFDGPMLSTVNMITNGRSKVSPRSLADKFAERSQDPEQIFWLRSRNSQSTW